MESAMANIMKTAQKAVAIARAETCTLVMDKFVAFLSEKIEIDAYLQSEIEAFRATLAEEIEAAVPVAAPTKTASKKGKKAADKADKKPRKLNFFNMFTQDKMHELKEAGVKGNKESGNLLKQATAFWSDMSDVDKEEWKAANADRLEEINSGRLSDGSSSSEESTADVSAPEEAQSKAKEAKTKKKAKAASASEEEQSKAKEVKPEKKAKATSKKSADMTDIAIVSEFLEMLSKSAVLKTHQKKIEKTVRTMCEQMLEDMSPDDVDSEMFMETFKDVMEEEDMSTIAKHAAFKILMEEFKQQLKKQDAEQEANHEETDNNEADNDEEEEEAPAEEDEDYY